MITFTGIPLLLFVLGSGQEATPVQVQAPATTPPADLPQYLEVTPLIGTGGQPSEAGFRQLAEKGYQAIVNLRAPGEEGIDFEKQRQLVESLGMKYFHIPFLGREPTEPPVDQFLDTMEQLKEEKVFVHCRSANRAGAVMLCKRVLRDGLAQDRAEAEAKRIGLESEVLQSFARGYVEKHRGGK